MVRCMLVSKWFGEEGGTTTVSEQVSPYRNLIGRVGSSGRFSSPGLVALNKMVAFIQPLAPLVSSLLGFIVFCLSIH